MIDLIRTYFARRRIKAMFGEYVSPAQVERMAKAGVNPLAGPTEVDITPFFASIHSYVGLAEQLPLPRLRELMNAYFEAGVTAIEQEGGTIDKFIGDAIVARFGAPVPTADHAVRACAAALRVQAQVGELRERFRAGGWPERAQQLRVRIGLHSGDALVGNLGTTTSCNYTMMGDNVNIAARLETSAKDYGLWTLCTDATQRACEAMAAGWILFRPLGRIVVKGRAQPIELFEPVAFRRDASDQLCECISVFESGLVRWRERDWTGAIALFEESARLERDQPGGAPEINANPSTVYLEMARSFRDNPGTGPLFL